MHPYLRTSLRLIAGCFVGLLSLIVLLVLLLRVAGVQQWAAEKGALWLSDKTDTHISIQKLRFSYRGDLLVEGLLIQFPEGDTLLYSQSLRTQCKWWELPAISVPFVDWEGLQANIQQDAAGNWNFARLLAPFVAKETDSLPAEAKKKKTSETPELRIGPIHLSQWELRYGSATDSLQMQLALGNLELWADSLLPDQNFYGLQQFALHNSRFELLSSGSPAAADDDSSQNVLPRIRIHRLDLGGLDLRYTDLQNSYGLVLGRLALELPELDLDQHKIRVDSFLLADSRLDMLLAEADSSGARAPQADNQAFVWPDWQADIYQVHLLNTHLLFQQGASAPQQANLQSLASRLHYRPGMASMALQLTNLREGGGLQINHLGSQLSLSNEALQLKSLQLRSGRSDFEASGRLNYPNIDALLSADSSLSLQLACKSTGIYPIDFARFMGDMAEDARLKPLLPVPLSFELITEGDMRELKLDSLQIDWGDGTRLAASGKLVQLLDSARMQFNLPRVQLSSVQADLNLLYADTSLAWPTHFLLDAGVRGSRSSLSSGMKLHLPGGTAFIMAAVEDTGRAHFTLDADLQGQAWAELLKQPDFGNVELGFRLEGSGRDLANLEMKLAGELEFIEYLEERYEMLRFEGELKQQQLRFAADMNQMPLAFDLKMTARLDSLVPEAELKLRLIRASLKRLGLRDDELVLRMQLDAGYRAQGASREAELLLTDGLFQTATSRYPVDSLRAWLQSDSLHFVAGLRSELAGGEFRANAGIDELVLAIRQQLRNYLPLAEIDSLERKDIQLAGELKLYENRLLTDLLVPELRRLDSSSLQLQFDQAAGTLRIDLQSPAIDYGDVSVRGMYIDLNSKPDSLEMTAGFARLQQADRIDIHPTRLQAEMLGDTVLFGLRMQREDASTLYALDAFINRIADTTHIQLLPNPLVLQGVNWQIPKENYIRFAPGYLRTENFSLQHQEELLALSQDAPDALDLQFEGFRLSNISALLNADSVPLRGRLEGEVQFEHMFSNPAAQARLAITRLRFGEEYLGNMRITATNPAANRYDFSMGLADGAIRMRLEGNYEAIAGEQLLNLQLQLDTLQLSMLTAFSNNQFSNPQGFVSARFDISGSLAAPQYTGSMRFRNAALTVNKLNNRFSLPDERIRIDNAGMVIEQFELRDPHGHRLFVSGTIKTPELLQPELDLRLRANNFQLIDATAKNNPMFYGKASVTTEARLQGSFSRPIIEMKASLNKGSKLWFVVPESQAGLVEREGLVLFTDMRTAYWDSLFVGQQQLQDITGITLMAVFQVDPETELTVIVDERSGDKLQVSGRADLRYELFPNGRMTLSGVYEVNRGAYDLSLYDVVQRKFEISQGSTISWRGDVLDAALDLRARYRVNTSAIDLLSEQLSGVDASTLSRYRQELPFDVYTNIRGELLKPQVSFSLDMPENQRGVLDGNVYARVQQLNQQESELNKQVFSLLVLNRFLPAGAGSQVGASATTLARSSASQVLSGQLNSLSARYIKAVDVDMNLSSFTDYQGGQAQDRTVANVNVRKNLLDDRLVVQLGSQVDLEGNQRRQQNASDIIGDVTLEYLLTESGDYRISAFRRNQFEGLIEGQLIVTGTSLVFSREFNRFSEAFKRRAARPEHEKKAPQPKTEEVEP
ncbi:MAG: translocation/assembly module TamB domain-containing protein [Bacteroidia bacterium]